MTTHRFEVWWAMLPIVFFASVLFTRNHESLRSGNVPAQNEPQSRQELLDVMDKRFEQYETHFIDFEKSDSNFEHEIAMELQAAASETSDYIHATNTLLFVYSHISCEEDRTRVKPFLKTELHSYSTLIDRQLTIVKLDISHTERESVAGEAARMQDDMRRTKGVLDSIKLR